MISASKAAIAMLAASLLVLISVLPGAAQEADIAFSNEKIDSYGFPELHVTFNGSGFDVPETVEAGYHVVVLEPGPGIAAYVDFMQVPDGIPHDEAVALALEAAAMDVPSEGWTYGGGSYAFMDRTNRFIVYLTPGEWQIAASYQEDRDGAEETMELYPLTVGDHGVSSAGEMDPEPDVVMTLEDVAFGGLDTPIDAGPTLFEVRNTGEQPRQMVLFRTDRAVTADDFAAWFAAMESATPVADPFEMTWVGYTALTSPGHATWIELDLEPGTYTATSWVIDPETQMPALLLGMVQSFEVR